MKKILASLIILSFAFVPVQAIAKVKSGDTCKSLGLTGISKGKKFTCIKSGKKLIWNKGTSISVLSRIAKAEEQFEISKVVDFRKSVSVYGEKRLGFICWNNISSKDNIVLQVKKNGIWLHKQIGFQFEEYSLCPSPDSVPVFFSWIVDELGENSSSVDYPRAKTLEARTSIVNSDGSIKFLGDPFLLTIYQRKSDLDQDFVDAFNEILKGGI